MMRTVVIEVCFHIGELYFLMPFLYSIRNKDDTRYVFLFTKRKVYRQYKKDRLLRSAMDELKAETICSLL